MSETIKRVKTPSMELNCRYPLKKGQTLLTPIVDFTDIGCSAIRLNGGKQFPVDNIEPTVSKRECLKARIIGDCPRGFESKLPSGLIHLLQKVTPLKPMTRRLQEAEETKVVASILKAVRDVPEEGF